MPTLALLFSDPILAAAVAEQFAAPWEVSSHASLEEALSAKPDALLAEVCFLQKDAEEAAWPSLVFAVAKAGDAVLTREVTETFSLPLRLGHLVSRIQLHHSSAAQTADAELVLGPCKFYPQRRLLVAPEGVSAKLTEKEAAVLAFLYEAAAPVPRDELLAALWGYDGRIDTHTLETHVYRLRALPALQTVEGWREVILMKQGCYILNPAWCAKERA